VPQRQPTKTCFCGYLLLKLSAINLHINNIKEVMYKKLSEFSRNTKRALLVAIDFIALPVAFIDDVEKIGLDIHGVKSYM
jgi:hypothetical protein